MSETSVVERLARKWAAKLRIVEWKKRTSRPRPDDDSMVLIDDLPAATPEESRE